MRILFLSHAFNSLTQRLHVELTALGHEIAIKFDINDSVTVLQAEVEMDAGPVWASATFPMRVAKKSSLYRNEVTEAAARAVCSALERLPDYPAGTWMPEPQARGRSRPLMKQTDRAIDWRRDDTAQVQAKLNCGDGFPGVRDSLFGQACHLYNARAHAAQGEPGALLGREGEGVVRATVDGAMWIGHAKTEAVGIKLPVAALFAEVAGLEALPNPPQPPFFKGGLGGISRLRGVLPGFRYAPSGLQIRQTP